MDVLSRFRGFRALARPIALVALAAAGFLASPTYTAAQIVTVRGVLYDQLDGQSIADATLLFLDSLHREIESHVPDPNGRFEVEVGAARWLLARAPGFLDSAPIPVGDLPRDGRVHDFMLGLVPLRTEQEVHEVAEPGTLMGEVRDGAGRALAEVEVRLDGELRALTNVRGTFRIDSVGVGVRSVVFSRIGLASRDRVVRLGSESGLFLAVVLDPSPVELEPIVAVAVSRRMLVKVREIEHRMRLGLGSFVTKDELAERSYPSFEQFLRGTPGVNFMRGIPVFRLSGSIGMGWCPPTFYVDGVKLTDYGWIRHMPTLDIELIELYKGASSVPAEYAGTDARCGVIVIWTGRGTAVPLSRMLGGDS